MPDTYRDLNMRELFLIVVAVIFFGKSVNAQTESALEASNFLILVENTKNGIKLTSRHGCAFKELSFSLKKGQTQEIDQFGMRTANENVRVVKDDNLASFRFTITKVNNGPALDVVLEGIEGTSWKKLSFTIPRGSQ